MNENYNTDGVMKQYDIIIQKNNKNTDKSNGNGNRRKKRMSLGATFAVAICMTACQLLFSNKILGLGAAICLGTAIEAGIRKEEK